MPWNTRLKPYTTRMAKIQGPKEGKTNSNIYKEVWKIINLICSGYIREWMNNENE